MGRKFLEKCDPTDPATMPTDTYSIASPDVAVDASNNLQFLALIDLQMEGLETARRLAQQGEISKATKLVCDRFRDRLAESVPTVVFPGNLADPAVAREQADRALENRVSLINSPYIDIGTPIDWFTRGEEDNQWSAHLSYMSWILPLATTYAATRDEIYAEKWFEIIEDFLTHHAYGSPAMEYSPSRPMLMNDLKTCNNGESRSTPVSWMSLSCHFRIDRWLGSLAFLARSAALTDERLIRILGSLTGEHAHIIVGNPRENTPNQFIANALSLLRLSVMFPEFKICAAYFLIAFDRVHRAITNCMPPDGSDLEQSFNYNSGLPRNLLRVLELLKKAPPSRREFIAEAARKRTRFLAAVTTPSLQLPSVAKTNAQEIAPTLLDIAEKLGMDDVLFMATGGSRGTAPGFTSVAIAYGGYYVLRSDWTPNAEFLFFKASAPGIGHAHEDCLSLHASAWGRDLLVDSGNFSYTLQTPKDLAMNDYCKSTWAHNGVLVDGEGQERFHRRSRGTRNHDEVPELRAIDCEALPNRHWLGKNFGFVEGVFADGFGKNDHIPVRHRRQIIWLRGLGWLVLDRLFGDHSAHRFTQLWQLGPEFGPHEVAVSPNGKGVRTQTEGVNLALHFLNPADMRIELHSGEEQPARGWFCPDYSERVPKTDVHVNWEGSTPQTVATFIHPLRPSSAEVASTDIRVEADTLDIAIVLSDGSSVTAAVSTTDDMEIPVVHWKSTDGTSECFHPHKEDRDDGELPNPLPVLNRI